ncbi:hypothetical protein GNX71_18620 [Variovorax sp. RKNM96]|uniref:hypothetical protein n=1 Tax=Variovorax sp. RKNM96 TaxID=2681552 RepID=UPI00197CD785|nr:hypothetical protein [Variovorax sp. RKNM96]QSI31483.1 hypothetical protein GNX71_18620 [Variovorax sp. RKNM96]
MNAPKKGMASIELLHELHDLTVRKLIKRIQADDCTAAELTAALKALKDNGVEQAAVPGSPIADLAASLPFAGGDSDSAYRQ